MNKWTKLKREFVEGKVLVNADKRIKRYKKKFNKRVHDFFHVKIKKFFDNQRKNIDKGIGEFSRRMYCKKVEVVPNRLFFTTFNGTYNCNQKYIT